MTTTRRGLFGLLAGAVAAAKGIPAAASEWIDRGTTIVHIVPSSGRNVNAEFTEMVTKTLVERHDVIHAHLMKHNAMLSQLRERRDD